MAEGINRVQLLGNLGADPELRHTQGGQAVLNMRLATTESYIDRNKERKERTDWHSVVLWGARGEALSKFLRKGKQLFVEGRLATSSYEDKSGQKRYKTEVVASNVVLLGGRDGNDRTAPSQHESSKADGYAPGGSAFGDSPDDADIPF